MPELPDSTDFLIVGGGTAGCVLASRLSENWERRVVLIEAGPDVSECTMPVEIRQAYPSRAFFTREFFHPDLFGLFGDVEGVENRTRQKARYEQARVLGGGSTINGLVGNRGAPSDYDEWAQRGAAGWSWEEVLPYFRKLERDLDFSGKYHGNDGPIAIRRLAREDTTGFIRKSFDVFRKHGFTEQEDQNAQWTDGVMAPAITLNERGERSGTATSYLPDTVRARKNLQIICGHDVEQIVFKDGVATGAIVGGEGARHTISAGEVVLCCGAINTPALMMRSGVGPGAHLKEHGIDPVADITGVGRNLHEHPAVGISCFVRPGNRHTREDRHHTQAHLRFSSTTDGCPQGDMMMALLARSAWHRVGSQLATYYLWVNKPYSTGCVSLAAADPKASPEIDFRLLSDPRDLQRMREGFRLISNIARDPDYDGVRREVFPTIYSDRVRKVSRPTAWNAFQTGVLASVLDVFGFARASLIRGLIAPVDLGEVIRDDDTLDAYLDKAVVGVWHPSGTCRMGGKDDPGAVTDPDGKVYGVPGLRVCDASLMPSQVCANTNLPTIMIAERIADRIAAGH